MFSNGRIHHETLVKMTWNVTALFGEQRAVRFALQLVVSLPSRAHMDRRSKYI